MPEKKDINKKLTSNSKRLKKTVEEYAEEKMGEKGESLLVSHAKRELELAGVFDQDADYDGMLGDAVMELVRLFASQHHSGTSGSITLALFDIVAKWELLSEPTDNPDEWQEVTGMGPKEAPRMWQNKRGPAYFSNDGGKHWRHVGTDRQGTSKHVKKGGMGGDEKTTPKSDKQIQTPQGKRPAKD